MTITIFDILKKLTTELDSKWIKDIPNESINPFMLQKWLSMHKSYSNAAKELTKYTFYLSPKMFLALAWSITDKEERPVYFQYIKKNDIHEIYIDILYKIKATLKLSDNDWKYVQKYYIKQLEDNPIETFKAFGYDKKIWKKYGLI